VGLLIAVGVLFVAAVNTGANLVYLMTALIFSLFLVSIVLSRREARGIESTIRLPVEGREGESTIYHLRISNPTSRARHLLRFLPQFEPPLVGDPISIFSTPAGESIEFSGEVTPPMRGIYRLRNLVVQCLYPAVLICSEVPIPTKGELVVLPAPLKHPLPVFAGFNQKSDRTETGSNIAGDGSTFFGLREYRIGDPINRIHWKATARAGKPLCSEQEEDRVNRYYIFMDLRESKKRGEGRESNLEASIRIAATLSRQLLNLNCPVRIYLMDSDLSRSPHSFTTSDIHRILRFLGGMEYTRAGDFPHAVERQIRDVPPGSYLIFILPDGDAESVSLIDGLRHAPYSLFAIFNLPDRDSISNLAREPAIRSLRRAGVTSVFYDATSERVVNP